MGKYEDDRINKTPAPKKRGQLSAVSITPSMTSRNSACLMMTSYSSYDLFLCPYSMIDYRLPMAEYVLLYAISSAPMLSGDTSCSLCHWATSIVARRPLSPPSRWQIQSRPDPVTIRHCATGRRRGSAPPWPVLPGAVSGEKSLSRPDRVITTLRRPPRVVRFGRTHCRRAL